jgi:hypothetical protein
MRAPNLLCGKAGDEVGFDHGASFEPRVSRLKPNVLGLASRIT